MRTDFVLDALEQAIYARRGDALTGLVHRSDAGSQYLSMRYTDRLVDAGIAPSVGSQGDAYDNALAESVIGLYKTEVIRRKGPWRTLEAVEFATLTWVDWFNTRRLLGRSGTFHQQSSRRSTMSRLRWPDSTNSVSEKLGTIQCQWSRHPPSARSARERRSRPLDQQQDAASSSLGGRVHRVSPQPIRLRPQSTVPCCRR